MSEQRLPNGLTEAQDAAFEALAHALADYYADHYRAPDPR